MSPLKCLLLVIMSFTINAITEYSLDDCYKLALQKSFTVASSLEQINQAQSQVNQGQAGFLPTLSFKASRTYQDTPTNALGKSISPSEQTTTNFNLSQNLFQGLKDLATVRQKKHLIESYEWAKKKAMMQLYQDISLAFYSVLSNQADIKNYQEQILTIKKRKNELASAQKSGRARESDVVTAESSIANLESSLANAKLSLASAEETLIYLTGISSDLKLKSDPNISSKLNKMEYYLESIEERPDIQESKKNILIAQDALKIAQAKFFPTLTLGANYYTSRPPGVFNGVKWDTNLTLTVPLFTGGLTRAQVSEASTLKSLSEINQQQIKEQAIQKIRTLYRTVEGNQEQLKKLIQAKNLAEKSYSLMAKDNSLGNTSNTEVLTSLANAQEHKRNADRVRLNAQYNYIKLQIESAKDLAKVYVEENNE